MKFTCPSESIVGAIVPLMTYVSGDMFTLELAGNELTVVCSTRSVGASASIMVHGETDGEVDLPSFVATFIKKMPEGRFTFEHVDSDDGDYVMLSCGKSKMKSATMRGGHVVRIEQPSPQTAHGVLESKDLQRVVGACAPASQHAWATGVYFDNDDGVGVLVATDSVSLAKLTTTAPPPTPVIIPADSCLQAARVGGTWNLEVRPGMALFYRDGMCLWTSVIKSNYPNYKMVVPSPTDRISVLKAEILEALDRLLITDDGQASVRLEFSYGSPLTMSIATSASASREEVDVTTEPHDDFSVLFGARSLISAIKAVRSDDVVFGWSGPMKPVQFASASDDILYIMQPIVKR